MKSKPEVLFSGVIFFFLYLSFFSPVFGENPSLSLEDLNSFFEQGKHLEEDNLRNLEKACINHWPKLAGRNAKLLEVRIGKVPYNFESVGQRGTENSQNYYFIHYFSDFEVALVFRAENTWDAFHLLSKSGEIEVYGIPQFSQNGEKAMAYRSCEMNGNDFSIIKFEKGRILEELCLAGEDFAGFGNFATPRWLSDNSVEITGKSGKWDYKKENPDWIKKKILLNFDPAAGKWNKTIVSEIVNEDENN